VQIGQVNRRNRTFPNGQPWSSDSKGNESPVSLPLNGFTIAVLKGQIVATWNSKRPQTWSVYHCNVPSPGLPQICGEVPFGTSIQVNYTQKFDVVMKSGSDSIVAFKDYPSNLAVVGTDYPDFLTWFFGGGHVPQVIFDTIQTELTKVFENFTVPDVKTFALTSLLFPSLHVVHLQDVALTAGLYLTGSLDQPITVSPDSTTLNPGQGVQLKVDGIPASQVAWKQPRSGSISATGYYTAPASISSAEVIVITAMNRSNASSTGSAMVLVYPGAAAGGVAVAPYSSLVTPGQQVELSTTDARGKPVSVNWTLSPDIGQIDPDAEQGLYIYTAPASLSGAAEVTASAVNSTDPGKTGKAIIRLVPSTQISVKPDQSSLKYGGTLDLVATVPAGDTDDLRWLVYPIDAGKIVPNTDDPTKAVYSAPSSSPPQGNQVSIIAYLVDDQAGGLGKATITLTS
jgi:hypothetical protein